VRAVTSSFQIGDGFVDLLIDARSIVHHQQNVLWLHVSVDDLALGVKIIESLQHLREIKRLAHDKKRLLSDSPA